MAEQLHVENYWQHVHRERSLITVSSSVHCSFEIKIKKVDFVNKTNGA